MTKKSLADLLREEAQKSPDLETEAIEEIAPAQPLEPNANLCETEPLYETTDESSPVNMSTAPRAKRTSPTKAELETTVSELREASQEAHRRENSLQQQIANLQSGLQEQKILVQKLQLGLEQTNHIKEELEEARKVILQLTEINSKTTKEVNPPREQKEDIRPQKWPTKKLPHYSIQPNSASSKLPNKDLGWFD